MPCHLLSQDGQQITGPQLYKTGLILYDSQKCLWPLLCSSMWFGSPAGPRAGEGVLPGSWFGACGAGDGVAVPRSLLGYCEATHLFLRTEMFDFYASGSV